MARRKIVDDDGSVRMEGGLAVEQLHAQLLVLTRDVKYGFESFRCDWGPVNSVGFNRLMVMFRRSLRELAKASPVKWYSGKFYMFNGKIYESVDKSVVEQAYLLIIEDMMIAPVLNRSVICKEVFLETIKLYNILSPQFDIVAFENGVVDFGCPDPQVMPFSPSYHVTYYHPYRYDPNAKCVRWQNFLHEVLPSKDARKILQMFLGLGLVQRGDAYNRYEGKATAKIELCLILIGSGSNGKGVVFEVATALFGRDRVTALDYPELTSGGDEGMRNRYRIRNAIFNWCTDANFKKFGTGDTGMFKRIVSGEPVTMRALGQNVLESKSLPYMIFHLNSTPEIKDSGFGFIRRMQYVCFDVTVPVEKQDKELAAKIIKDELPGVFNWVLRGARELRARRFVFPEDKRCEFYKNIANMEVNPIAVWLDVYGLHAFKESNDNPGEEMSAQFLYDKFCRFCADNDTAVMTQQKFGKEMAQKFSFRKKRAAGGIVYIVYGLPNRRDLSRPYFIAEEEGAEPSSESFIKEDD